MRAHSMRNVYQILHGDQTPRCDEMKIFAGRPRMLTRDLLAVDNLVNDSISTVLCSSLKQCINFDGNLRATFKVTVIKQLVHFSQTQ